MPLVLVVPDFNPSQRQYIRVNRHLSTEQIHIYTICTAQSGFRECQTTKQFGLIVSPRPDMQEC